MPETAKRVAVILDSLPLSLPLSLSHSLTLSLVLSDEIAGTQAGMCSVNQRRNVPKAYKETS